MIKNNNKINKEGFTGGALKNIIALCAGICDGMGFGDNTKAALIVRGISEVARLAVAMGAKPETVNGLTGVGDLIVTCQSKHSRNRKAGELMGQGMTMDQATKEVKMVVEGVYSAKAAKGLAEKYDVEIPIISEIKTMMKSKGALNSIMSGSGPSIFGVFDSQKQAMDAYDFVKSQLENKNIRAQIFVTDFFN